MNRVLQYIPEAQGEEFILLERLTEQMDEDQLRQFAGIYRARRRDPQNVLIMCVLGFIGLAGIHRFYLGQIGMGILFFFTAGLCYIGTIIDLVNYKEKTLEYNDKVANEIVRMV